MTNKIEKTLDKWFGLRNNTIKEDKTTHIKDLLDNGAKKLEEQYLQMIKDRTEKRKEEEEINNDDSNGSNGAYDGSSREKEISTTEERTQRQSFERFGTVERNNRTRDDTRGTIREDRRLLDTRDDDNTNEARLYSNRKRETLKQRDIPEYKRSTSEERTIYESIREEVIQENEARGNIEEIPLRTTQNISGRMVQYGTLNGEESNTGYKEGVGDNQGELDTNRKRERHNMESDGYDSDRDNGPRHIISTDRTINKGEVEEVKAESSQNKGLDFSLDTQEKIDYVIKDNDIGQYTPKERYKYNITAIKTLKTIESENRLATKEEQEILSKYTGWGAIQEAFDNTKTNWSTEYKELKEILTESEYQEANQSINTAFYTQPIIINSIYKALDKMGFKGGKILEPSCGIGNFFGLMPEEMKNKSFIQGVELDEISGRIARQLYQNANIEIKGYEKTQFTNKYFDVAIGNVPFGKIGYIADKQDPKISNNFKGLGIHDYFFIKTLDKVRPGGIIAFITATSTLDNKDTKIRKKISQEAEFLGAIRLPNTAFKKNAGTETASDIIFLKKRDFTRDGTLPKEAQWINTEPLRSDSMFIVNEYIKKKYEENLIKARYNEILPDNTLVGIPKVDILNNKIDWILNTSSLDLTEKEEQELLEKKLDKSINLLKIENIYKEIDKEQNLFLLQRDEIFNDGILYIDEDGEIKYNKNIYTIPGKNETEIKNNKEELKQLIQIREKSTQIQELLIHNTESTDVENQRIILNQLYDNYKNQYGTFSEREKQIRKLYANTNDYQF
ncbi:MAG: hypothetical protein Q4F88_01530 [Eubacteriales bacterium]|nr:hypothetical protein [Eubacteriales bacterium]